MAVAHTVNKKIEEIVSLKVTEMGWLLHRGMECGSADLRSTLLFGCVFGWLLVLDLKIDFSLVFSNETFMVISKTLHLSSKSKKYPSSIFIVVIIISSFLILEAQCPQSRLAKAADRQQLPNLSCLQNDFLYWSTLCVPLKHNITTAPETKGAVSVRVP